MKRLVGTKIVVIGAKLLVLLKKLHHTGCQLMCKVKHNKIIVFEVLMILLELLALISSLGRGDPIPWQTLAGAFLLLVVFALISHGSVIVQWLNLNDKTIEKYKNGVAICMLVIALGLSFYMGIDLLSTLPNSKVVIVWSGCILYLVAIVIAFVLCAKILYSIRTNPTGTYKDIVLFLYSTIQIILLFANIYIIIYVLNENWFQCDFAGIPIELCFEFTYFSAMTFLTGSNNIEPSSILTKIIVLIETFTNTVLFSFVLFSLLSPKLDNKKKAETEATKQATSEIQ